MCSFEARSELSTAIVPSCTTSTTVVVYPPVIVPFLTRLLTWLSHLTRLQASVFIAFPVVKANILGKFISHVLVEHIPLISSSVETFSDVVRTCALHTLDATACRRLSILSTAFFVVFVTIVIVLLFVRGVAALTFLSTIVRCWDK